MSPRIVWVGLIVSLLVGGVATQAVLIVSALNDPSFAVEPDYERKANRWDEHRAQQARNRELDWTLDVGTNAAGIGQRLVWVQLFDTWGKPIMDAEIGVETFHNARAGQVLKTTLRHERDGRYVAMLPMRRPGVWELRLRATRGDALFTAVRRKSLAKL